MDLKIRVKNYLWRSFEINSSHSPEKIESELSRRIIKEPVFHFLPYYEKLYGNVGNGKFVIKFAPTSSIYMRGAGRVSIKGEIVKKGTGSCVRGCLPGPPFAIWVLAAVWLFMVCVVVKNGNGPNQLLPFSFASFMFLVITIVIFAIDRSANQNGEGVILGALKEIAG